MFSLSKNSCAKEFGNWRREKTLRPKIPKGGEGGGGESTNPLPSLRVNLGTKMAHIEVHV